MKIIEFRLFMPLTLQELYIGQEWFNTLPSKYGDKIISHGFFPIPYDEDEALVVENLPEYILPGKDEDNTKIDNTLLNYTDIKELNNTLIMSKYGQYTKIQRTITAHVPWLVLKLLPLKSHTASEQNWSVFPYTKQVITNGYLKKSARIENDTIILRHTWDRAPEHNVHNLEDDKLKQREIVIIDITKPDCLSDGYESDQDPTQFESVKTGRGRVESNFWRNSKDDDTPLVCIYQLVILDFKLPVIQNKVESSIANTMRNALTDVHRKIYCSMDEWMSLNQSDVRKLRHERLNAMKKEADEEAEESEQDEDSDEDF